MKNPRLLSIGIGLVVGVGACWALDRYGSGVTNLLPKRTPNPGEALTPDEIIAPEGRASRIPSQVEDVMRGIIRAGGRVWMEKAGNGWEYVAQELGGSGKAKPQSQIIEITPQSPSTIKVKP